MIRLENVIKIYGEDYEKKIALNNICLEIKDGEFVAVTGPSGSGKSTLLNIIGVWIYQQKADIILTIRILR